MTAVALLVYLLIALLTGLLAERLLSIALPGGLLGAILAALLGIVLLTQVLHFTIPGDVILGGVPFLTALLGATLVLVLWLVVLEVARAVRRG